jgi:PIN domain nuclease of toxin-antitoxin system
MITGIVDTHTVIWYLVSDSRLSTTAKVFIDNQANSGNQLGVSSITLVEMVYLIEKNRISATSFTRLVEAMSDSEHALVEIPVDISISRAVARVDAIQVPDMPDRIIAATALLRAVPIVSRDSKIKMSGLTTIW